LTAQAEIPALFQQRPIVARHQKAAMYHPFIEAAALTLVDIPITFIILVLYTIILYFLVGLQASAGQYLCIPFSFCVLLFSNSAQHILAFHLLLGVDDEGLVSFLCGYFWDSGTGTDSFWDCSFGYCPLYRLHDPKAFDDWSIKMDNLDKRV
jgi:hypothetical protein